MLIIGVNTVAMMEEIDLVETLHALGSAYMKAERYEYEGCKKFYQFKAQSLVIGWWRGNRFFTENLSVILN